MNEKIAILNDLGDPRDIDKNKGREWFDYLQYGFTEADVPELLSVVMDTALYEDPAREGKCIWVHLHAWRTLGQLKSVDAIEPLISMFNYYMEVDDEWALDDFSEVMAMIGGSAIEPLSSYLSDFSSHEYARVIASDALGKIVKKQSNCRDKVIAAYREYMLASDCSSNTLNGLLVSRLTDMKAVELIDDIRQMFQNDCVELSVLGDLEDVEIELGLRTERETTRPYCGILPEEQVKKMRELLGMTDNDTQFDLENFTPKTKKVGRNEPCPCGSGKKYKKCCLH
ncbi:MAG TPA: DUF1186 domain-containing protein [Leucothrix mucor]|nr:DUF1186 domain-containing protein [Leucothrix mucor]